MKKKKRMIQEDFSSDGIKAAVDAEEAEEAAEGALPKEETMGPEDKMEADIALFHQLFPDVKGEDIPPEVWERVEGGESLAAAFSLYEIQRMRQEEKIRRVNEDNEKKAPPRIRHDGNQGEYFSPEAVKAMSPKEIRKNYDAILRSMENWN